MGSLVKNNAVLSRFSPHVFWNCNLSLFDVEEDKDYIIERVLEYGFECDEILLWQLYSGDEIKNIILGKNNLSENCLLYLKTVLNLESEG